PTNDCSICILSPKLVEVGRHVNVELLTLTDVQEVSGREGDFTVKLTQRPRYVDMDKCIACGICSEKCPKSVDDHFNADLNKRKAIYVQYPQAVPLKYAIDEENCIYFSMLKKGKPDRCKACEQVCPAGAVKLGDTPRDMEVRVGSIIFAPGFTAFDPTPYKPYGYGTLPNVVTSLEFERILSASGPFQGHLKRPSDGKEPKRVAWLQCVGSRDINVGDRPYCSAVCCMYAIKEAVVAREHATEELDTTIFFMDMRTYGKDFEKTYDKAKASGVRFIRSRVHTIVPTPENDMDIEYVDGGGALQRERFDLVVLSVGLDIDKATREMAGRLGLNLTDNGFAATSPFSPVASSRPGIYVCGAINEPKDIPISVMEASAAASAATSKLAPARFSQTQTVEYPPERDVSGEPPRIGVFVCNCGINIGGVVDVPAVTEYARSLPFVEFADENLFSCSQDTQGKMVEAIKTNKLNRIIVAACSPRTHEPLFMETLLDAGLNKYLFEMANIRNHDSWVHANDPVQATIKAKDQVRMAVAKAALLEPLQDTTVEVNAAALVIGGGVAGMNAALALAEQGFKAEIVEKSDHLGGNANRIFHATGGQDVGTWIKELIGRVEAEDKITVHLGTTVTGVEGFVGNFKSDLSDGSRIQHGVAFIATGATELKPDEYLYGSDDRVMNALDMDALLMKNDPGLTKARTFAFIQCVGSREPERPYCSKVCCTHTMINAIELKKRNPDASVYVLYRDIRTYGERELLYREARGLGVIFIRYDLEAKPRVEKDGQDLLLTVKDHILDMEVSLKPDYLVLASAVISHRDQELAQHFKVPLDDDGWFLEAHQKLRPVDFATDGVFLAGLAHYPKPIDEAVAQSQAAASRAVVVLSKDRITVDAMVSYVDEERCIGCGLCQTNCPFAAIDLMEITGKGYRARTITASCKGCGVCAAGCPQGAIDIMHSRDAQITAAVKAGIAG
ncbi:MAG: FAD-dependent oxidoreductase, partial [Proteobacteria bacterium]|nr:FAD-dependent oxidoreductase [Pseudomonadota bacterium]